MFNNNHLYITRLFLDNLFFSSIIYIKNKEEHKVYTKKP